MRRRSARSLLCIKSLDDADRWAVGQLFSGYADLRCLLELAVFDSEKPPGLLLHQLCIPHK
jgi:hypothetical protein